MANFSYSVSYAGVPLLTDQAKVVKLGFDQGEPQGQHVSIIKHQPHTDLWDELNKLIDNSRFLQDYGLISEFLGRDLTAIARQTPSHTEPSPNAIRLNEFYYPNGASQWSVFRGLATSTMVRTILQNLAPITAAGWVDLVPLWQNATFVMQAAAVSPNNPQGLADNYTIATPMYMLPPRPLAEHGGRFDGLYLITLVDERYYWQFTPTSLKPNQNSTWNSLLSQLATSLNVTINFNQIPQVYGTPEPDSQFWVTARNSAALLDAVALNIGCTVIRNLDGSYQLFTLMDSQNVINANLLAMAANFSPSTLLNGTVQPGQTGYPTNPYPARTAGGDIFNSGTGSNLPVGDLTVARNAVLPSSGVNVTFPKYIIGNDPVPHLSNSRYQNQRPSAWYEESYGDVLTINVPLTSGGSFTSGLIGSPATVTLHTTAKALYSGEVQL